MLTQKTPKPEPKAQGIRCNRNVTQRADKPTEFKCVECTKSKSMPIIFESERSLQRHLTRTKRHNAPPTLLCSCGTEIVKKDAMCSHRKNCHGTTIPLDATLQVQWAKERDWQDWQDWHRKFNTGRAFDHSLCTWWQTLILLFLYILSKLAYSMLLGQATIINIFAEMLNLVTLKLCRSQYQSYIKVRMLLFTFSDCYCTLIIITDLGRLSGKACCVVFRFGRVTTWLSRTLWLAQPSMCLLSSLYNAPCSSQGLLDAACSLNWPLKYPSLIHARYRLSRPSGPSICQCS